MRPMACYLVRTTAVIGLALACAGCAVTSADGRRLRPGSDAFADYVEAVFRRQNEIATALSLALDTETVDTPRYLRLEDAEIALQTACSQLNAMALAQRDGRDPGGLGALRRARSAPDCELAAASASAALE